MATPAMSSSQGTSTMRYVPLNSVQESKTNPRKHFDKKALHELALSIAEKGVLVPLLVRPAKGFDADEAIAEMRYEIVAGARRYRAAKEAGADQVPVIVRELDDLQALEVQVIENLQRRDVHPLEEAEGYKALLSAGKYKDVDALAAKVGKSVSYVYQRLKLAELNEPAKKLFLEEKITAGHAILIARLQPEQQKKTLTWFKRDDFSVRELAHEIDREFHLDLSKAAFPTDNVEMFPAVGACTTCPKRTGNAPQLFEDVEKGDTCTDPACFHGKERAFVKIQVGTHPDAIMLTAGYVQYGHKPKGSTDWHAAGSKKCDHTREGVIVESDREEQPIGNVLMVCTKYARCKVHNEYYRPSSSSSSSPSDLAGRKKRQAAEQKQELERQANRKALIQLMEKAQKPSRRELELIAAAAYMGAGDLPNEFFGWKHGLSYVSAPKVIAKLTDLQLGQLLIALAYEGDSYYSEDKTARETLAVQCAKYKIDRKAILDELVKSHASAKKGTCQYCGCTETKACKVRTIPGSKATQPCSWIDATKTVCSNPKCIEARKKAKAA
jgi:ParB family chromosome partitioning protein